MSTVQRLRLDNVDWRTYSRLLGIFAERPSFSLAYDRGRLEITGSSFQRENDAEFLSCLTWALTEELGLPIKTGGSMTLRRRRFRRGIDPNRCFWINNEPAVRGKRHIDLRVDPPPDLAIEVDVTSSSLNRMGIYAALGVPEVWRLDHPALSFHALGAKRSYSPISHSLSFPFVTPADLMIFLVLRGGQDENRVVRQFRAWIQQRIAGGTSTPSSP